MFAIVAKSNNKYTILRHIRKNNHKNIKKYLAVTKKRLPLHRKKDKKGA
jgi:hypothetical protein